MVKRDLVLLNRRDVGRPIDGSGGQVTAGGANKRGDMAKIFVWRGKSQGTTRKIPPFRPWFWERPAWRQPKKSSMSLRVLLTRSGRNWEEDAVRARAETFWGWRALRSWRN